MAHKGINFILLIYLKIMDKRKEWLIEILSLPLLRKQFELISFFKNKWLLAGAF